MQGEFVKAVEDAMAKMKIVIESVSTFIKNKLLNINFYNSIYINFIYVFHTYILYLLYIINNNIIIVFSV